MDHESKWLLTNQEKDYFISALSPNLPILRTQANISQEELANLIGISRQTYSAIERNMRKMSWSTYLGLVLFYDHNKKTHQLMRHLSLFPTKLIIRFNEGVDFSSFEFSNLLGPQSQTIIEQLDAQALDEIRKKILEECKRCSDSPAHTASKAFEGYHFGVQSATDRDVKAMKAIRAIIKDSESNE